MCNGLLDFFGSDSQKSKWQKALCEFNLLSSYCLTEPGSGSDATSMLTFAKEKENSFVLNGSKAFISGGDSSDLYFVMVKTAAKEISCIIVEKNTPGLSFGKKEDKLG
jgi:Acyl-CoA dehydrogenases